MTEKRVRLVRLVCPMGRKRVEAWGGAAVAFAAIGVLALAPLDLGWRLLIAVPAALLGTALAWDGFRHQVPVLQADTEEFSYTRGHYVVRIPFAQIGSYYVLDGRTRSLGLCDITGRPQNFPSVRGRRATRPYLPLTAATRPQRIEEFMSAVGIPPRDRSLTAARRSSRRP